MKVDVQELLKASGIENEVFYPGKRIVKKFIQHGEHKSHCAVFDWHDNVIHIELKAGMTGRTLDAKTLHNFPVSFQAATYLDIEPEQDNEDEEDGSTSASGKSGGGGKKPVLNRLEDPSLTSMNAFSKMADGAVSTLGEIKKFVVMGKEIAKESYAQAFENLKVQLAQTKVMVMDLMKDVSNIIHRATPGGGLTPKGDETIKYKYDAEKNGPMFGGMTPT